MSQIRGRECLSRIEDYVVETVPDADIIVNANETNEPMGKKMEKKLVNAVLKEALNRYPSMHGEDLCAFLGKKYGLEIQSEPDIGTTVTLRLAAHREPPDESRASMKNLCV